MVKVVSVNFWGFPFSVNHMHTQTYIHLISNHRKMSNWHFRIASLSLWANWTVFFLHYPPPPQKNATISLSVIFWGQTTSHLYPILFRFLSILTPHHRSINTTTKRLKIQTSGVADPYKIPLKCDWILIRETRCRVASWTSGLPVLPLLLCCYTLCPRCDLPPPQTSNHSLSRPQATNRVTRNSSEPHYATELN